jgi:hypothetical protein
MTEKSAWEKYKEALGDTRPWDLLKKDTEVVDEEKRNIRLEICNACPQLISLTSQCKLCGCFMKAKTKIETATCPIGKW